MSNKEAAEMIRDDMKLHHDYLSGQYRKALNMAISALQAQEAKTQLSAEGTTSDLISRHEAIDAMCLACGHDCDKSKFVYNAPQDEQVIMCPEHYALSTLPSTQPEPLVKESRTLVKDLVKDCISRQAAIDALEGHYIERINLNDWQSGWNDAIDWMKDVYLDELPPTPPEPQWIPVSERLPDDLGNYLVSIKRIGWNMEEYVENDIAYWDDLECFHKADEVLAWMPLPEPYRAERRTE